MNPRPLKTALVWTLLAGCAASAAPQPLPPAPNRDSSASGSILVTETVSGKDAAAFAGRLAALLGAQVRLPQSLKALPTLPPGRYTPETLLAQVRQQINAAGEQGDWREVFLFQTSPKNASPAPSQLHSAGRFTIDAQNVSFSGLARQITRSVGVGMEMPQSVPGRYTLSERNAPVEQALSDLAAQAGLTVTPVLVFTFASASTPATSAPDQTPETAEALEQKQEDAQVVKQSQDTETFLQQSARLQAITGMDPLSPDFNIQAITPLQWTRLGLSGDALAQFRESIVLERQEQSAAATLSQQELDQLNDPAAAPSP